MTHERLLSVSTALLLLAVGTGFDPWQSLYRSNREGNRAMSSGDPDRAVEHYADAQALAPDDPRVLFNLGNALAEAGRRDDARRAWERASALGTGELARDAWYNRGVAALAAEGAADTAQEAVEAFGRALMIDPADREARRNLELALRRLPPPQQRDQQTPGGENREDDDGPGDPKPKAGDQGPRNDERPEGDPSDAASRPQLPDQDRPREGENGGERDDDDRDEETSAGDGGERNPRTPDETPSTTRPSATEELASGDGSEEMAERWLQRLADDEMKTLRRALRRQHEDQRHRERDW